MPKTDSHTSLGRFDAPRDPIYCERCGFVGPGVRYVDDEDVCTDRDACGYRFGIAVRVEQSEHGIFAGTWWRTTEVFGAPGDFA